MPCKYVWLRINHYYNKQKENYKISVEGLSKLNNKTKMIEVGNESQRGN